MSRIDALIQELCPYGVEHAGVLDIADYVRGITYSKNDEDPAGEIQVLRANNITLASNTLNFENVKRVSDHVRVRDAQRLLAGDTLICAGSGSRDHLGKVAYIREDIDPTFGGFMAVLRTKDARVESRFLFHILTTERFKAHLDRSLSTSTINNLNATVMRGFRIPVPPLDVQREIVRILDKFTQLEAELEAELEARRAQYEFYRRTLLGAEEPDSFLPLGELLISVRVPKGVKRGAYREGGVIPIIDQGKSAIAGYTDDDSLRVPAGEYIVFGDHTRAVKWVDHDFAPGADGTRVFRAREGVLSRYAFFAFQQLEIPNRGYNRHWTVAREMTVPVPSLKRQREVVAILDYFDALVNDISIGLPAELVARRKQYEYYRDRLLTFEEQVA